MYNIYIRDSNFKKIGEITDFTKLELIPRFNAVGSFTLELQTDSFSARQLINPQYGIIVKKNGKEIFSGNVTSRKRSFNPPDDTMLFSGKDDNFYLSRALAYPEPFGHFETKDYDVRTGNAETVMKQYVSFNAGPDGPLERNKLIIETDIGLGSSVTGRARFDNLLDLLSSLALQGGGLGFKVVQIDDSLQFQVYQPTDKTKSVFFSPILGNIANFEYSNDDPDSNLVVVGGSGEGTARIIDWKADNDSIVKYGRIETFVDRRDTTDSAELTKSMDEELTNKAEKNSFTFTAVDISQLAFNRDYGLGDKISVVLTQPNEVIDVETLYYFISAYQTVPMQSERIRKVQEKLITIQDIVREVKITIDSSGEVINPTVGTEDTLPPNVPTIYNNMKKLNKRISNIERV